MSEQRVTLSAGLHAPADARAWIGSRTPPVPDEIIEDTLLVASELVTNAVRHGRPDVSLALGVRPDRVRIEVYDGGDDLPVVPDGHPSVDRPSGRGLLIVAATAADWGVERTSERPGKCVWAELRRFSSQDAVDGR